MSIGNDIKAQGLSFARSLQMAFRGAAIYSPDHPAVLANLEQAFARLSVMLEACPQVTFGFSKGSPAVNGMAAADPSLAALEAEFKKRDVGSLWFSSAVNRADFRRLMKIIGSPPAKVVEAGGLEALVEAAKVENAGVISASRKQSMGGPQFIEAFPDQAARPDAPPRKPPQPRLDGLLAAAGIQDPQGQLAKAPDLFETIQAVVGAASAKLEVQPEKVLQELAAVIAQIGPEQFPPLANLRHPEGLTARELAEELWEAMTAQWLTFRLTSAATPELSAAAQDQAVRLLLRSRRSPETVQGILRRMALLLERQGASIQLLSPLRDELEFSVQPFLEQKQSLMHLHRLSQRELRRMLGAIRGLAEEGEAAEAAELAEYGCKLAAASRARPALLETIPELIRAAAPQSQAQLLEAVAARLGTALHVEHAEYHQAVSRALQRLALQAFRSNSIAALPAIAGEFDRILAEEPEVHDGCCGQLRRELLPPEAIAQMMDYAFGEGSRLAFLRVATAVMRGMPRAIEQLFHRLEEESNAVARFRILRFAKGLGEAAVQPAVQRIRDGRWFVVRNFCSLLGDLQDPDLIAHVAPCLRHPDLRVQQTALQVLRQSRRPGYVLAYAEALPDISPILLDTVLDEILLGHDAACVPGIGKLLLEEGNRRVPFLAKAVQIALALDSSEALLWLRRALADPQLSEPARAEVRRGAENARTLLRPAN